MSLKEFKLADPSDIPIAKLFSLIAKSQSIYLNHNLKDLDINVTQLHLLFEISHHSNLNQEKLASRCTINKGAVARSIKKLEEKELIVRQIDEENRRQNKVSLTPKGKNTIKKGVEILNQWEDEVFDDSLIDENELKSVLKQIALNSMELNQKENENE